SVRSGAGLRTSRPEQLDAVAVRGIEYHEVVPLQTELQAEDVPKERCRLGDGIGPDADPGDAARQPGAPSAAGALATKSRRRTSASASTAPQPATTAPTTRISLSPETNDAFATAATWARRWGGTPDSAFCAWPLVICCATRWAFGTPGRPAATFDPIRSWKIAPSAAIPVAMPSCRNVLFKPEAIPARSRCTVDTAVDASGALTKPIPTPPIRKPARSAVQPESTSIRLISHIATAQRARPAPSRILTGRRDDSRPATGAAKNETALIGRKRMPVCSGE